MKTFELFLKEGRAQNGRLDHIEDCIFSDGLAGARRSLAFVESLYHTLTHIKESNIQLSIKWDGSPAIVCGTNPVNNRFFVGTKSVFNHTPKINYTIEDIQQNHGHSPTLVKKLTLALEHLSKANIKSIIQGDLLYTEDTITPFMHNGESYIAFKPNTITYAVPTKSPLAESILTSKLGIAFHTGYVGSTIQSSSRVFGADLSEISCPASVVLIDPRFTPNRPIFMGEEVDHNQTIVESCYKKLSEIDESFGDIFAQRSYFGRLVKRYINHKIREGASPEASENYMRGLVEFLQNHSPKYHKLVVENYEKMSRIISFVESVVVAKNFYLSGLTEANQIHTFIESSHGVVETFAEGFVASMPNGSVIKLVNRLEFSRANFGRFRG
jgi:hypothetical protein